MTEPKPQTAFTKDYIEKRIEARIASLESRVAKMQEEGLALTAKQAAGDAQYLKDLHASLVASTTRVKDAQAEIKGKPAVEVVNIVNRVEQAKSLDARRAGLTNQERESLKQIMQERQRAESEVAMIQHALAYLKDSPVTEFSITALSKLGLLDAVKFSLELPDVNRRR